MPSNTPLSVTDPINRQTLRAQVGAMLDDTPDDDDDLMDFGLTSINVMTLVTAWGAQGYTVNFINLASAKSLNDLWKLLCASAPTSHGVSL